MNFDKFFRLISYAAVFCGFLSLWVSGTFGIVGTGLFIAVMILAWNLEGSRWQISDRVGTALIVLALPAFYFGWKFRLIEPFSTAETVVAGVLARMILSLTSIKLLQKKSSRDWIFLYLMSFFEVLLAAGLSISALYLASFLLYLLVMVAAIIAFEIRKTAFEVESKVAGVAGDLPIAGSRKPQSDLKFRKLSLISITLIVFIVALAAPVFFMLPRVGGAGLGSFQNGMSTSTGFSDKVSLGSIGRIQQNDAVVMRVKLDVSPTEAGDLYFRGVALDTFDNKAWSKFKANERVAFEHDERDLIQLDFASGRESLLKQTIYLEPLDTPILFAVPKMIAVHGNFPALYKDGYGAVSFAANNERISYTVASDRSLPSVERLRSDNQGYSTESQNYLQLPPHYDSRIAELAATAVGNARSRYDKAMAIESYLRNSYGYTLEMKSGGDEPLADFLFNIREGHCEYFATAMAVMLRTQGVATRIVNGFHAGEFNATAGLYVVRQRNAHAWVEVYFPKENVWVPFDPTPASSGDEGAATGIIAQAGKYLEALDSIWIQYFVAFDDQEQRSLARTMRTGIADYQSRIGIFWDQAKVMAAEWWTEARGDHGVLASMAAFGYAIAVIFGTIIAIIIGVWSFRRLWNAAIWSRLWSRLVAKENGSIVEFYERMQLILAAKGMVRASHETPLEFALASGIPQAVDLTDKYNRVRFGQKGITPGEADEIELWLSDLENGSKTGEK